MPGAITSRSTLLFAWATIALATQWVQPALGDEAVDRISALERLVESQNKKIEALTQKVQMLEQREQERTNATQIPQLPTIVIDTNGVPVIPPVVPGGEPGPTVNRTPGREAQLSVGRDGFSMSSADASFILKLKGHIQLDSRTFFDDDPFNQGNDSFVLRRARPIIEGTVFKDINFQLIPDFGGSSVQVFDAWMNYRYRPELQFRFGKFKGPIGFENQQLDTYLPFNERSLVSDLMPVRSVGVEVWGSLESGILSYALGVFNGTGDGRNPGNVDFGDDKEIEAGINVEPFALTDLKPLKRLGIGIGGSYSQVSSNALAMPSTTGGSLPGYTTSALQQFFAYDPLVGTVVGDGDHWRLSPYIYYLYGPFGFLGEYALSRQGVMNNETLVSADLEHRAWEVSGQWVLTGEPASFTGINPRHPLDFAHRGWGAWQLVARYSALDVDKRAFQGFSNPLYSANSATSWSAGINWWLNKNVRLMMSYAHTRFAGGGAFNLFDPSTLVAPATVTRQDENVFLTRLQLAF